MRRQTALGWLVVVVFAAGVGTVRQDDIEKPPPDVDTTMKQILAQYPKRLMIPAHWKAPDPVGSQGPTSLPPASITEPFEIGEALHDPTRVESAVVSLLALMRIGIAPAGSPLGQVTGGERLRLTEAEVRGLIAMGTADANAIAASPTDSPPYSFKDLHRSLSPLLKGMSIEQLAERYSQAYEKNPEWLVPKALMGQPIEPDTPLMRTQLWLLLADAVGPRRPAPPRSAVPSLALAIRPRSNQAVHVWASTPILPDPRVLATPDARFTDAEWQELMTRIPLFASGIVSLSAPRAHEKHGGGANVQIEGRLSATPPSMVSSVTGRLLLVAKSSTSSIAGLPIAWNYAANILRHGTMNVPQWTQTTVGAGGVAQLTFTPKDEVAKGRGELMRDSGAVDAYMSPRDVMVGLYNLPAGAQAMTWGQVQVGHTDMTIEWHALDTIHVQMLNEYRVRILGALQRDGTDYASGILERAEDGTYHGELRVMAVPIRTVLPGADCRHGEVIVRQAAYAVGTPIPDLYSAVRSSAQFFEWDTGKPANYLRLEIYPKEPPRYLRHNPKDPEGPLIPRLKPRCYDEIGGVMDPSGSRTPNYAPLNAAQWTVEHAGYAIAIPAKGEELLYKDLTGAGKFFQSNKTIAGAVQQLAAGTDSKWYIWINQPPEKK